MSKSINTVLGEASVVGAAFVVIFMVVSTFPIPEAWPSLRKLYIQLFLSAALFHVGCEYSGINEWYSKNYIATA